MNISNTDKSKLKDRVLYHLEFDFVKSNDEVSETDLLKSIILTLRDHLIKQWLQSLQQVTLSNRKRVYYLSLEFLMGRLLTNTMISLGVYDDFKLIAEEFGYNLDSVMEEEQDMGLGNGGLGRLAACFLDSLSTLQIPATGYSILYKYGIFKQELENGYQVEKPDDWLKFGNPWIIIRPELTARVKFNGRVETLTDENKVIIKNWCDTHDVLAIPYDILIPGYHNSYVNNLRLWQARSTNEFNLYYFNRGDYVMAVEEKNEAESISKVLYPNDSIFAGKLLRLKQQYFFVSASLQDIIRQHKIMNRSITNLHEKAAIQLNETHPSIAIPELMRILTDEENLDWETAWNITRSASSYTNHTIAPEALESWQADIFQSLLPRHYELIEDIDNYYKEKYVKNSSVKDINSENISIISGNGSKVVRMANLAVIGSHSVNGVSELHTDILKNYVFNNFCKTEPDKFVNITNGVSVRRFLFEANPYLSGLISSRIGIGWITESDELNKIEQYTDDDSFKNDWQNAKKTNKLLLTEYIKQNYGLNINPDSLFDSHIKRLHEYKRQLLKIFHVIYLYNKIKKGEDILPRTVIMGGKAAPSYFMAKLHIKLINCVAGIINNDTDVNNQTRSLLKVIFIKNYGVSLAEKIIPASELSEQISTAGFEASGTGNMKFALNGALTVGTLDGANIEIRKAVGEDNIFIFGMDSNEVMNLRKSGYTPGDYYESDIRLKQIIDMLSSDFFNKTEPGIFRPIVEDLLRSDYYMVMADFDSYIEIQDRIENEYRDVKSWIRKSIINTSRCGKFSSDRTVKNYAEKIWCV
jgi:starch phosphorylase